MLWRLVSQSLDEAFAAVMSQSFLARRPVEALPRPRGEGTELASGDLGGFYGAAPAPPDLQRARRHVSTTSTHDIFEFAFPSSVETAFPENNRVPVRHWRRRDAGDAGLTVIGMGGIVQLDYLWFGTLAERLAPSGVDLMVMHGPYNFERAPSGYRPGELITSGNLWHQLSVTRQATRDLWSLVRGVQAQGRRVGLVGMSYGGWIVTLAALLEERLECVVAMAPPVDILRLFQRGGPVVRALRRGLGELRGKTRELAHLARPIIPALWHPRLAPERIDLHLGSHDRIVCPASIEHLATRWRTRLTRYSHGHYTLFTTDTLVHNVTRFVHHVAEGRLPALSAQESRRTSLVETPLVTWEDLAGLDLSLG